MTTILAPAITREAFTQAAAQIQESPASHGGSRFLL